ncbi:MAG: 50S ribosomal protein L23 [Parcubacteria group bacterium]|nr:50S ribosomal protein L23 [Parcubacteria group bacterium]
MTTPSKKIILRKPHLSEKSTDLKNLNQYVFDVATDNKQEIKKAVEQTYHVNVVKIRTINLPSKPINWRNKISHHARNKKAIVTIKEGQKIELGI